MSTNTMGSAEGLPNLNGDERFKMSDHQLLSSGFFADCELILGDRVWKLHKSVVCLRSKYFERALMGNWPEAKTGKITLTKELFTEEHIEWLINFIYTGVCDLEELKSKTTVLYTCAELFILGDYFLVPALCDCALDHILASWLGRHRKQMGRTHPWLHVNRVRDWVYDFDGEDWLNAMRRVYEEWPENDNNLLKKAMMQLSTAKIYCRHELLGSQQFLDFIDEEPRFARDFMKTVVKDKITKVQGERRNV